jgi:hypothetical protein
VVAREPGETFVQTVAARRTRRLHVPISITDARESELLLNLVGFHCCKRRGLEIDGGRSFRTNSPSGKSCLLANIKIIASRISLSLMIRWSSCRASSIRSLSAQSTTKMRPCVPVEWMERRFEEVFREFVMLRLEGVMCWSSGKIEDKLVLESETC